MNPNVAMTLDDAVAEVLGLLTGLDLEHVPEYDRYQAVTRQLNRALRANATEHEWSYYSSLENVGIAHYGDQSVVMRADIRPRIIGGDAVQFRHPETQRIVAWAYFLPRDELSKYNAAGELKAAYTRQMLHFSRPLSREDGLEILVPVMREPKMFELLKQPEDPDAPLVTVPDDIREQKLDFDFPDLPIARAAYYYAQSNPLWQPRVPTLEENYKNLMYSLQERDKRNTDAPYQNEWHMGIEGSIYERQRYVGRPNADWQM